MTMPFSKDGVLLLIMWRWDLGWVRVMTGVKQGDSGQRRKPAGLIN